LLERYLDLRELTNENQRLFCQAAKLAASRPGPDVPQSVSECLSKLADQVIRVERGEAPLSRSDWIDVVPSNGRHLGPGWCGA
jgi:hypothetical protein